jgi:4-carboxymuconolactone decarboxylase
LARIPLPTPQTMTPEQRRVHDAVVAGPRRALVGPLRAALHSPELAERWQLLGDYLRYRMSMPLALRELAILVTARRWNAQLEWQIHEAAARKAGVDAAIVEAIGAGRSPEFSDADAAAVYEFARELQELGQVSGEVYGRVLARWEVLGVVELTALIGYYTMVAMTLNAHEIPLLDNAQPPLQPAGGRAALSALPPGRLVQRPVSSGA